MITTPAVTLARSRWESFATNVARIRMSTDIAALYQLTGDRRRAQVELRMAIGEAASLIATASDIAAADATWSVVCDAMAKSAEIYIACLETQLADVRRSGRLRTSLSRHERNQITEMGLLWAAAMLHAVDLYAQLGGDAKEIRTFDEFYETMKRGKLFEAGPPRPNPWPDMEN